MRELFRRSVSGDGVLGDVGVNEFPADGTTVTATTYPSNEYDRPAQSVTGPLETRPLPHLGYTQCWVDGVQVDPATVHLA